MKPLSERLTERELIHRGDLTCAYRARDAALERFVFVKVLNPALSADAETRARFEREAKAVARLDHPNLVRIFEYGEDPHEGLYMILEWVEGRSLDQALAAGERFSGASFVALATQLLHGLAALHSVGILHRDLKPHNILVKSGAGGPLFKITDFGLAALRDAPRLTHHEAIVGTPAYMSPEQAAGVAPDERSDLFSLGVVLLEAVTGENPFAAPTLLETLRRVREQEVDFSAGTFAELPEDARGLLERLLKKSPAARPSSALEALQMLGEQVLPDEKPLGPRSRKRTLLHLAAAVFVIAVWAVLMILRPWREEPVPTISRRPATAVADSAPAPGNTKVALSETTDLAATGKADAAPSTPRAETETAPRARTGSELQFVAPSTENTRADSADLVLMTEPWSHVFLEGELVGTTPLSAPLRVPVGRQKLLLRNPAFPPVLYELEVRLPLTRANVRLAEHASLVRISVTPWGEVYVDGEHAGTTPLARPLFVSPGRHELRITHPQLDALQQTFNTAAGETLLVEANLSTSTLAVRTFAGGR